MSAENTDKTKPRKQFLNIVYFVESSRTRTLKIPMGQVHVLLFCALVLVGWSIASTAIISLLVNDRAELVGNLKQTMQTVFEFESLYDGVYERAYPSGKLQSSKTVAGTTNQSGQVNASAQTANQKSVAASENIPKQAAIETKQVEDTKQEPPKQQAASVTPSATPVVEEKTADPSGGKNVEVTVSNPVVKTTDNRLNLTFDLTNKNGSEKSEGYIWATAEFKAESGEVHILKAPLSIDANSKGEIADHRRASFFAIRRFKRNEFSFELLKGYTGIVVGVKIGISDKPGANKMIYDVPLGIKVGSSSGQNKKTGQPKKS
jgi:hypothetical protein